MSVAKVIELIAAAAGGVSPGYAGPLGDGAAGDRDIGIALALSTTVLWADEAWKWLMRRSSRDRPL